MKLNKKTLKRIIKEELESHLKMESGYYIELVDGIYNEDPYATEEDARMAVPGYLMDQWPAPKIIKID